MVEEATDYILKDFLGKDEISALLDEYNDRKTEEAKFAYHCDKLDCDIQIKLYDQEGCFDLNKLFSDVYDILKINGIFLFTYQIGQGEEMADEPYLKEKGKNVLYMSYQSNEDIKNLLNQFYFEELFRKEKVETSDMAINANEITTAFVLVKKIK